MLLIKIAFFAFLLAFFEAFGVNKWCLPIRYFKRKTYSLLNAVFRSLFVTQEISKQKASKIRFFIFSIFEIFYEISFSKYFSKFQFFKLRSFSAVKCMNVLLIKNAFFAFLLPFFEAFGENKWCLSNRCFKRNTYYLQNAIFGSLFVT